MFFNGWRARVHPIACLFFDYSLFNNGDTAKSCKKCALGQPHQAEHCRNLWQRCQKMRYLLTLLTGLASGTGALAQNLPSEWYISDDGRRLVAGGRTINDLFDEDSVPAFHLWFAEGDFWNQLVNNYDSGTPILAILTYNGNTYDSVGVKFKGETSYFMLPPGSQKMSFDINLDEWIPDQKLAGYQSINLNNGFQDNSMMRDVVYKHLVRQHIPDAKASFAKLYINGENWGVYDLVQDLDGDFIRQWWFSNDGARWRSQAPGSGGGGQWGDGTAALNYLGADTASYQPYYTLKKSNTPQPWDHLVTTCAKLNNTALSLLADTLDKYMDLDRVIWHLACENAFADDDSYIHKGKSDYNLYWEPETGRMTTQEIDGNSVLSPINVGWSPFYHAENVNYPLLNRLLGVQELRQRYLAHLRTVISASLNGPQGAALMQNYRALIDTMVQNDPKKLMTYAQFTAGVAQLTNQLNTRRSNLLANMEVAQVAPTITSTQHESSAGSNVDPPANEPTHVRCSITSNSGTYRVRLRWSNELPGRFQSIAMLDDGAHNDGVAGDGVFGADIPGQPGGTWVRYYLMAEANNAAHSMSYDPAGAEHDVYVYQMVTPVSPINAIVINELMASNASTVTDNNGQYEDWIELYNRGTSAADLQGWYLTDTPFEPTKWQLPAGTVLEPNAYMIVWADEDASQGAMHTNFKLSASGESVLLFDPDTALADHVDFGAQEMDMGYARVPNGTGPFIIQLPTYAANNNDVSMNEHGTTRLLRAFPNPTSTAFTLQWDGMEAEQIALYDAMQRLVWKGVLRPNERIDVSELASGAYVAVVGAVRLRLAVVR